MKVVHGNNDGPGERPRQGGFSKIRANNAGKATRNNFPSSEKNQVAFLLGVDGIYVSHPLLLRFSTLACSGVISGPYTRDNDVFKITMYSWKVVTAQTCLGTSWPMHLEEINGARGSKTS